MKKLWFILLAVLIAVPVVFAGGSGVSVYNDTLTLYSGTTGTTVAITGSTLIFSSPVKDLGCDISSSPTTTVLVQVYGQTGLTSASSSLTTGVTATCLVSNCNFAITGRPLRAINAVVTTPTLSTSAINVTCTGMQ